MNYLSLLAALAAVAAGQGTSPCSTEGTKTITSQEEANSLADCTTFTGSLTVTDGPPYAYITLKGIKEITGTLTVHDWYDFTADSLERIGGAFINHDSYTSNMHFPRLLSVGSIEWTDSLYFKAAIMPNLAAVNGDFIITGNRYFEVLDNTSLQRVGGQFQISENNFLVNLTFPSLSYVDGGIDFSGGFYNVSMNGLQSVHPKFFVSSTLSMNCTAFDEMRKDGPLASTESYSCTRQCYDLTRDGSCPEE